MGANFCDSVFPVFNIHIGQKFSNEVFGVLIYLYFESERILVIDNFNMRPNEAVGIKWRIATQHFVQKNAYAPPITLTTVDSPVSLRILVLKILKLYIWQTFYRYFEFPSFRREIFSTRNFRALEAEFLRFQPHAAEFSQRRVKFVRQTLQHSRSEWMSNSQRNSSHLKFSERKFKNLILR